MRPSFDFAQDVASRNGKGDVVFILAKLQTYVVQDLKIPVDFHNNPPGRAG